MLKALCEVEIPIASIEQYGRGHRKFYPLGALYSHHLYLREADSRPPVINSMYYYIPMFEQMFCNEVWAHRTLVSIIVIKSISFIKIFLVWALPDLAAHEAVQQKQRRFSVREPPAPREPCHTTYTDSKHKALNNIGYAVHGSSDVATGREPRYFDEKKNDGGFFQQIE